MKITKGRSGGDRYQYDIDLCSYEKGWVQIDTDQDASYYGHWCNFDSLQIFVFVEGDTYLMECDSIEDFKEVLIEERNFHSVDGRWNIDATGTEKTKYIQLGFKASVYQENDPE